MTLPLNAVIPFFHRTLKSYFDYINPCCDLDIEDSEPIFLHNTLPHDNTPPYQIWLKMVERFRIYHLDKTGYTERMTEEQTDRQSDSKIPLPHWGGGGGVGV